MESTYLTRRAFVRRAEELVASSRELGRSAFTPGATALLVVDMQRYFVDSESHAYVPGAERIVPPILSLAQKFSLAGLPVVFTRHVNTEADAGALALWWDDLISKDDPMSEIVPSLDVSLGELLTKTQYDAFHGTDLGSMLRARGAKRVVVTGVVTHLCCETTARSAFVRGFEVTFPVDGTATYAEEYHLASLVNLSHGFAALTFVEDLAGEVGRSLRSAG